MSPMEPSAEGVRWAVEDRISASSSALVLGSEDDGMAVADVGAVAAEAGASVLESPVDAADEAVYDLRASAAMERGKRPPSRLRHQLALLLNLRPAKPRRLQPQQEEDRPPPPWISPEERTPTRQQHSRHQYQYQHQHQRPSRFPP